MNKSQIAMICGLLVVILGSSTSVNATLTPIGPFNGLWSESFDSMPGGQTHQISIMGGNATISLAGDWLLPGAELITEPHFNTVVLDFVTPVDAFGAYMRIDDSIEYRRNINVRFFDSGWNDVGGVFISTPGCTEPFGCEAPLLWYGYVSSVPFQSVKFGYTEAHWLTMDDLQANPIPEPTTMLLLGSGLLGLWGARKKFKK